MASDGGKARAKPAITQPSQSSNKRIATVYDAVAGRVGLSGFLSEEQQANPNLTPSAPEEVLLRRVNAPDELPFDYYDADDRLKDGATLPDSDLLKALHTYASDLYASEIGDGGTADFRSFDETALLALGIVLEEATKEMLGDAGDMVLTESAQDMDKPIESKMNRHQIIGKVVPRKLDSTAGVGPLGEEDSEAEASPRKKQK